MSGNESAENCGTPILLQGRLIEGSGEA